MLRTLLIGAAMAYVLVGGSNSMQAQEPAAPTEYDMQALRLESSWTMKTIIRGREGVELGRIGHLRAPDVAAMVAPSEVAVREAKEFKSRYDRGQIALAAGTAVMIVATVLRIDAITSDSNQVPAYVALGVATPLLIYGSVQLSKGYTALGRAIWWYNRELRR